MQALLIAQNYCQNSDNVILLCFTNLIAFFLAVTVNIVGRVYTSRAFSLPTCRGTLELVLATGALHTAAIRETCYTLLGVTGTRVQVASRSIQSQYLVRHVGKGGAHAHPRSQKGPPDGIVKDLK